MDWRAYWKTVGLTLLIVSPGVAFLIVYGILGIGR